jgi:hypothetical protein
LLPWPQGAFLGERSAYAAGLPDANGIVGRYIPDQLFCRAYYPVPPELYDPTRPTKEPRMTSKRQPESSDEQAVFRAAGARELEPFRAAKREWSERLFAPTAALAQGARAQGARALLSATSPKPEHNVVGVGIGEKVIDDKPTGIRALKFLVRLKVPEGQMLSKFLLPKRVNGLPTDVEEVGLFRRFRRAAALTMPNPRVRIRPTQPGCSVGFQDPGNQFAMAGTFGALVKDDKGTYVLSNNHVLADEGRLPAGSPTFQPGLLDHGDPQKDQVAELTRFVALKTNAPNQVDGALAKVLKTSLVSRDILYIGPPQGTAAAALDMVVHKFGRTTGYRVGKVTSIDTDVVVQYEIGKLTFEGQIIIVGLNRQPFSDAGDSGSLILERTTQRAVGLLFAGSASHTIANHLEDVLKALKVRLV